MPHRHSRSAGFSFIEILVVIAIIGILSLISVPAFMNFQRANQLRAAMRVIATDLRSARAVAIREQFDVRVEFAPSVTDADSARVYNFYSSRDGGTTWTPLAIRASSQSATSLKRIERPVWIESATNFDDVGDDGTSDVIFHADGTATLATPTTAEARLVITLANGEELRSNRYNLNVRRSGIIRSLSSECSDQLDNDADGKKDYQAPSATDTADPQCASTQDNSESS